MDPYGRTSWAYAFRAVVLLGVAGAQALRLYRASRRRRGAVSGPTGTAPDTGWRAAMVLSAGAFAGGAVLFAIRPAAMRWSDALQLAGVGDTPAAVRWSGAPFVLAGLALLAAAHAALGRHFSLRIGVALADPVGAICVYPAPDVCRGDADRGGDRAADGQCLSAVGSGGYDGLHDPARRDRGQRASQPLRERVRFLQGGLGMFPAATAPAIPGA